MMLASFYTQAYINVLFVGFDIYTDSSDLFASYSVGFCYYQCLDEITKCIYHIHGVKL